MRINTKFKRFWLASCLLLLVLGGIFYFNGFHKQYDIAKVLKTLPSEDKEVLESFFQCLHRNTFSYVLFGDKPMSICSFLQMEMGHPQTYRLYDFMDSSMGRLSSPNLTKVRGWEVWKKYRQFFPSTNFILLENRDSERVTLVMINKQALLRIVEENIEDFRDVLGVEVTPQIILDRCIKSNSIFKDVLKCHNGLFGTLLGYGRHNAFLFSRREQISTQESVLPSPEFSTVGEECRYIDGKLKRFDENGIPDFNPLLMTLPMFVADHEHPETQQLKIKYKQQYKNIIKEYEKGDFLEITLRQFCSR